MTLERAVEVLNEHQHCELGWYIWTVGPDDHQVVGHALGSSTVTRDDFEVIAIAEKYEREKCPA